MAVHMFQNLDYIAPQCLTDDQVTTDPHGFQNQLTVNVTVLNKTLLALIYNN